MYWKYAVGFLIASLIQAGIIMGAEYMGISELGAKLSVGQLVNHILAGQAAGFLLMAIMQGINLLRDLNYWVLGTVYGILIWAILIPINVAQGTINAPWNQGLATLVVSLIAFVVYGLVATYTIETFGDNKIRI